MYKFGAFINMVNSCKEPSHFHDGPIRIIIYYHIVNCIIIYINAIVRVPAFSDRIIWLEPIIIKHLSFFQYLYITFQTYQLIALFVRNMNLSQNLHSVPEYLQCNFAGRLHLFQQPMGQLHSILTIFLSLILRSVENRFHYLCTYGMQLLML